MSKKTCMLAMMFVAIVTIGLSACGDSDNSPTSPTSPSMTFEPASNIGGGSTPPSNGATNGGGTNNPPNNPPADSGRQFTIMNGADVLKRQDCRKNEPGWFLPNGYDIRVRIDKNVDHDYRYVSNVFWAPEPSCEATNEQPGNGSSWLRSGKWLDASFKPAKECGRYQWDLVAINVTTGEEHDIFFGVLNTGNERCEPPPEEPKCEGVEATMECEIGQIPNLRAQTANDGPNTPFTCTWTSNADSCQVFEDGELHSDECNGQAHGYYPQPPSGSNSVTHIWNIVPDGKRQCDPSDTVVVRPQGDPCADSFLNLSNARIETNTIIVDVSSSSPGTVSAAGQTKNFPAGNSTVKFELGDPECELVFEIEASNECEDTDSTTVETEKCDEECEPPELELSVETNEGNNETEVCVEWDAIGDLSDGTLTLSSSAAGSSVVGAPGERCINISCDKAGGHTVKLRFDHNEDRSCSTEEIEEFEIDPCGDECEAPEINIDIETHHGDGKTEVWVEYSVDGGVGDGTVTVQLTDADGNVLRTLNDQPLSGEHHFELECDEEGDKKYYVKVTFNGETRECSAKLRKPFRVLECPGHECQLEAPERAAFCLPSPVSGGGQAECDKFVPGSVFLSKTESGDVTAGADALAAIVKSGASQCSSGQHSYKVIPNVSAGDNFNLSGQSHVTFCDCPPQNDLQALLGIVPSCGPNSSSAQPSWMRSDD